VVVEVEGVAGLVVVLRAGAVERGAVDGAVELA